MQNASIDTAEVPIIAFSEKNWDKAKASLTRNYHYDEVATGREVDGVDKTIDIWKGWAKAFPDSKASIHDAFVSGDTVVVELSWQGTHSGPLSIPSGEVAPTGKKIDVHAVQVQKIKDGKVESTRHYFDMATLMSQLGLKS
jgi:steroid delta-isomerase-like uncharacterized protein